MKRQGLIEEHEDSILFHLPTYRDFGVMIYLPFWLCGWLFGWLLASYALFSGSLFALNPTISPVILTIFLMVWFIAWTVGGYYFGFVFLRMAFGEEKLEFTKNSITIRQKILGFSSTKVFDQQEIWQLRTTKKVTALIGTGAILGNGQQTLAFDYGRYAIRFGNGINETSAQKILEMVQEKFPQYKPRDSATRYQWQPPRA